MFSDGRSAKFTHLGEVSGDRSDTRVRVELFEANGTLARTMVAKSQRGAFRVWDAWAAAEPATLTTVWGTPIEPTPAFDAAAFDAAFPPATVPDAAPACGHRFANGVRCAVSWPCPWHTDTAEILTMLDTRPVHGPYCALDGSCEGCSCKACDGPLSADEARRGALCPMCELNYR
jgi:hypothetical protein